MAAWSGPRQFNNIGQDFANTGADDDRIFIRWNEKYVRGINRTTAAVTDVRVETIR